MKESNNLFPIFLKLENLRLVMVGGGLIGLEKLEAVLANSPATKITLVATTISDDIKAIAANHPNIQLVEKPYHSDYLNDADVVVAAVNDKELATIIAADSKQKGILINAADKPELCDFYLGSIVKKGNLKIGISTNGKSPTVAKRIKEVFNEVIPDEIDELLDNMVAIRNKLKGDFANKVTQLNEVTKGLVNNQEIEKPHAPLNNGILWFAIAFAFVLAGYALSLAMPVTDLVLQSKNFFVQIDNRFYWMLFVGFGVEMIAGSMGMGYGVLCTSILLSLGLSLPVVSSSVHTSEMFGSAASAISHYKYGNINKKLFITLAIPGVITAILGALFLIEFGEEYAHYFKPIVSFYTLFLGVQILTKAFKSKKVNSGKLKHAGWLGGIGGFIDSVGGGGWGPLVTSTIISKGRSPRYAVGTSVAAKFCITVASAFTFFFSMGISQWPIIIGLVFGGVAAAPFAAKLTGKFPTKGMFIAVGILVISISLRTILKSFHLI